MSFFNSLAESVAHISNKSAQRVERATRETIRRRGSSGVSRSGLASSLAESLAPLMSGAREQVGLPTRARRVEHTLDGRGAKNTIGIGLPRVVVPKGFDQPAKDARDMEEQKYSPGWMILKALQYADVSDDSVGERAGKALAATPVGAGRIGVRLAEPAYRVLPTLGRGAPMIERAAPEIGGVGQRVLGAGPEAVSSVGPFGRAAMTVDETVPAFSRWWQAGSPAARDAVEWQSQQAAEAAAQQQVVMEDLLRTLQTAFMRRRM